MSILIESDYRLIDFPTEININEEDEDISVIYHLLTLRNSDIDRDIFLIQFEFTDVLDYLQSGKVISSSVFINCELILIQDPDLDNEDELAINFCIDRDYKAFSISHLNLTEDDWFELIQITKFPSIEIVEELVSNLQIKFK